MIKFSEGSHWYDRDGKPQHDADLRIARKEKLYPSVTSIDKFVFKNDFLDRWKMNQLVIAAGENMRQPHESAEQYGNRIYEISMEKSKDAIEFGIAIHKALEDHPQLPLETKFMHWFNRFDSWWKSVGGELISNEIVLLDHDIGVAGRTDRIASVRGCRSVIDYKTQDVKTDDKGRKQPAFYEGFPRQLGFYAVCDAKQSGMFPDIPDCYSLVVDSNDGGEIYEKLWTKEEIIKAYEEFVAGAWLWFRGTTKRKPYWPTGAEWSPFVNPPPMPE